MDQFTIDMYSAEKLPSWIVQSIHPGLNVGFLVVHLIPVKPLAQAALLDSHNIARNTDKPKS